MGIGRAELLILLGAIAIFGRYTLTINHTRYRNEFWIIACEGQIQAAALADGMLASVATKAYDEATVSAFLTGGLNGLTSAAMLGAEAGENYPDFDDIDDFNGLSLSDTSANGLPFTINVTVAYVSPVDWDQVLDSPSYQKRVTVTVISPFVPQPLTLSRIFCYYNS